MTRPAIIDRAAALIPPFAQAERPPPRTLTAFLAWCLAGAWPILAVATVIAVISGTFDILAAILLGRVIDASLASGPEAVFSENALLFLGIAAFLLILRPLVFGTFSILQSIVLQANLTPLVLSRLHRWTLGQSVTFFDNDFAGRIAQKQMQTSRAVTEIAVEGINTVIFALAAFTSATLLLITIDWRVALILAIWLAGYLWFITWFLPRIRVRSAARAGARAAVSGQVVDTITNMRTVKLFANAEHEDAAAINSMRTYRDRIIEFGTMATLFRVLLTVIASLLPVLLTGSVLLLWQAGMATPGDIAAVGTVSLRISQMTGWVSFALMGIYANVGEAEDGMKTLTPRPSITDADDAKPLEINASRIAFRNLRFTYGREEGGIEHIDLTIEPGEKIGLVGASGAGKSTLVSLLLRLYDPEEGRVEIDGQDIRHVTQDSLRAAIGMVTQETAMFNRTARDNIRYGRRDATDAEVITAAERAEAHDFITGLRDHRDNAGYDAFLGERGVKLSGGQRQRIALARAILKDAPILVLDEATSALDSEVEAVIQTALDTVMEDKTVIAIAHRLSTIARMDRIVVLDDGRIAEQGSHDDLLARNGLYARYWQRQSGGFLTTEAAE
ncbi:ABC transporter ATP-binding protein [Aestuariibius sp. 2305UL40-4]|uniref:ABC transporter ATP-binding protein n=1 Tax=Aestuariibius violaceus TaxID=3234132 RepID=UPI00345ECD8F